MSNIFFLNVYKCWKEIKSNYLDKGALEEGIVDKFYNENLKATRKEVYKYFKVGKYDGVNVKFVVRLYPYSVDPSNQMRKFYTELGEQINTVIDNLQKKIIPVKFLTENNDSKTFNVKNELINLQNLIDEVIDYNSICV